MNLKQYLPSATTLKQYLQPGPRELEVRKHIRENLLGCEYALVSFDGKLVIVPAWHPIAMVPQANAGTHYSHAIFEGGSARPIVKNGKVTGVNLIIFPPKMKRLQKSLKAQGLEPPVSIPKIEQGIKDFISIVGDKPFLSPEGEPIRAYIRPALMRGEGAFGVTPAPNINALFSCIHWGWLLYLPEEVYAHGGIAAAFLDEQRLVRIRGKLAGNYSVSGEIGKRARKLGAHEAVLFGPYAYTGGKKHWINYEEGSSAVGIIKKYGTIVDGPGEDILFFKLNSSGNISEIFIQPLDTNILGGTTRNFIIQSLAPSMGIKVTEKPITIDDIRKKRVHAMCFCGNAVNVAPMRTLRVYDDQDNLVEELHLQVSSGIKMFVARFIAEVSGQIPASSEELLTPVKFDIDARKQLDTIYKRWL